MARPRKESTEMDTQAAPQAKSRAKGQDALVTIKVETVRGTAERTFRVAGYLGNTLEWQRSGKGLDDRLLPGLRTAFGGQVTTE